LSIFRNSASLLLTSAVGIPILIVTGAVTARYLGAENLGHFRVALTFAEVGMIAVLLGWPTAAIYRLRRMGSPEPAVFTNAIVAVVAFSAVAALCAWLAGPQIAAWVLKGAPVEVMYLAFGLIPFLMIGAVFTGIARGIDRFAIQNWYRLGLNLVQLGALACVLILAGGGLREALIAVLAVHAAAAFGLLGAVWRRTGADARPNWNELRETSRFGLGAWIQGLVGTLHERVDVFMIAWLIEGSEQVAYFSIAVVVIATLKLLPESLAVAAMPRLASLEEEHASELASKTARHALLWTGVSIAAAALLGPLVIPLLYGQEFVASLTPFFILLPAVGFLTVYRVLARYFVATNRQSVNNTTQILSTVLNVGLNLWWIPIHGIAGAAWASFVSYGFECAVILFVYLRSTGSSLRDVVVFRREDLELSRRRIAEQLRRLGIMK
jgi:O-antigen/teichoic acid export membrane protein